MQKKLAIGLLISLVLSMCSFGITAQGATKTKEIIYGLDYNYTVSGEITVPDSEKDPDGSPNYAQEQFHKYYPNVKVKYLNYVTTDWAPSWQKFVVAVKAGGENAPDCIHIASADPYKHSAYLADLRQAPFSISKYQKLFNPYVWRAMKNGRNELTLLQGDVCPVCTWYRPDLLQDAGLPTDAAGVFNLIKTSAKLLDTAKKLKARGTYLCTDEAYSFLAYMGPRMATSDFKPIWTDSKYLKTWVGYMDLFRQMKLQGLLCPTGIWDASTFKQNKMALLPGASWSWMYPIVNSGGNGEIGKWRVTGPILGSYGTSGGSGYAISKTSKNKAAVWEYIKFMLFNPATQKPRTEINPSAPNVSSMKTINQNQILKDTALMSKSNTWYGDAYQYLIKIVNTAKLDGAANSTPVDNTIIWDAVPMLTDYENNGGDLKAVMNKWTTKTQADIDAFIKQQNIDEVAQ